MYVIVDLKWTTDSSGRLSFTQIAGIRVNANWETLDKFSSYICPRDRWGIDWKQECYKGGQEEDFLTAPPASKVLTQFEKWLVSADTLLWWDKRAYIAFRNVTKAMSFLSIGNRSLVVLPYVEAGLRGQPYSHGTLEQIAEGRGINPHTFVRNRAAFDARLLQRVFQAMKYPQKKLESPVEIRKKSEVPAQPANLYWCDPDTNLVHNKDCSRFNRQTSHGSDSFAYAFKKGFRPCNCCKKEYTAALKERNRDTIARTEYTYIYTPNSNVYHRPDCGLMLCANQIKGARHYKTVKETGRRPCKICRPTSKDPYKLLPRTHKDQTLTKPEEYDVPKSSIKAIVRYQGAKQERQERLNSGVNLTTEQRKDLHTLTEPGFAFWVSRGYKTFHLKNCPSLQGLSDLIGYSHYQDAINAGYSPCRHCHPSAKHDVEFSIPMRSKIRKDETPDQVEQSCKTAGFTFEHKKEFIYIGTPVGKWKINVNTAPIELYHINLAMNPNETNYHQQPRLFLSLMDVFEYIQRHDVTLQKAKHRNSNG